LAFAGSVLLGSCSRLFGGETMVEDKELTRSSRMVSIALIWKAICGTIFVERLSAA
jgi:hypothetical protein